MNECDCTDSDNYQCESSTESEISSDEDRVSQPKEKVLMAKTMDDVETKLLSQIKTLGEEEMKENLLEFFLSTMHKNQGSSSKTASKTKPKALIINASFGRNTRSFQRSQQKSNTRALTLEEVSQEIHHLKKEIVSLKAQVSKLEKGKKTEDAYDEYYTNPNIEIFEGKKDDTIGFIDMKVMAIQYKKHHVMLEICINGEMFSLRTLIDSGADVNIMNSKVVPEKYWVKSFRQVIGLGNKDLMYEVPQASIFFKYHCIKLKFVSDGKLQIIK